MLIERGTEQNISGDSSTINDSTSNQSTLTRNQRCGSANLKKGKTLMNISAYRMQGRRLHMEDYYDIGYKMKPAHLQRADEWPYEYIYFGIFDGHGGHEAAKFTKENLLKFITNKPEFWSDNDDDVMRAIRMGYAETHSTMRTKMSEWTRTSRVLPSTAGTTASVLFIRNGKFYSGHVGDSRIVISQEHPETKQWISEQVTEDHKPESEAETARIERAGGEVRSKIGVHRVVWRRPVLKRQLDAKLCADPKPDDYDKYLNQIPSYPVQESLVDNYQTIPFLAIARSLGDFWSINPHSGQYIVSPEPDISCRPITPNDKCILLATDGLWNVMNSSQASRVLQELKIIRKGKRDSKPYNKQYFFTENFYDVIDENNHALSLVYMAYQIWERRRLRSDNISAVVAMLSDILGPYHKSTQNRSIKTPNKTYSTRASEQNNNNDHQGKQKFQHVQGLSKLPDQTGPIQLEQTDIFCEKLRLNQAPVFRAPEETHSEFFAKIQDFLLFPPTILNAEVDSYKHVKISGPRNYELLSNAELRMLCMGRYNGFSFDGTLYLKKVSDDPDDRPDATEITYLGKSGKHVKDSSAQATQPIHDFGQPWRQLAKKVFDYKEFEQTGKTGIINAPEWYLAKFDNGEDEVYSSWAHEKEDNEKHRKFILDFDRKSKLIINEMKLNSSDLVEHMDNSLFKYPDNDDDAEDDDDEDDDDDNDDVVDDDDNDEDDDDNEELVLSNGGPEAADSKLSFEEDSKMVYDDGADEVETNDDNDVDSPEIPNDKSSIREPQMSDLSMPQLRCLMNCNSSTPTLRRSTRSGAYKSVTENPKRKGHPSPDLTKSKRRKSHPVQCSIDLAI